jgi:hypothetical protein
MVVVPFQGVHTGLDFGEHVVPVDIGGGLLLTVQVDLHAVYAHSS